MLVENLCHLGIDSAKLLVVAICAEGVGTVGGFLVALKGHGGFAVIVVGKAQQIIGQEAVVRCAVIVEELDVRSRMSGSRSVITPS